MSYGSYHDIMTIIIIINQGKGQEEILEVWIYL